MSGSSSPGSRLPAAQAATHSPAAEYTSWYAPLVEGNLLPDWLIRAGVRHILRQRLREESAGGAEAQRARFLGFVDQLKSSPIAIRTDAANAQHYEVPADFFAIVLGRHLKYSCGYWPAGVRTLDESEQAMLALTAERAQIVNGQSILDLGCGWGSLSLYLAGRFPGCRITGVSNSRSQKEFIDARARSRGLANLEIITADMNTFEAVGRFDRIVSVEMFEHMRNYQKLLARVALWMKPDARLFVHIFAHKRFAYPYEVKGPEDWMARHFFTGGIMPSDDLLLQFQDDVRLANHWQLEGTHYQKTSQAWLANMDAHRAALEPVLARAYGENEVVRWWVRWRLFFIACAELWGFRRGQEWFVSHYLFRKL